MIAIARRRHFSPRRGALRRVIIFGTRPAILPLNNSTFTAGEWPRRPAPAWPQRSRLPQSFAEWFPVSMPVYMITFERHERVFRTGVRLVQRRSWQSHDHLWPPPVITFGRRMITFAHQRQAG